MEFSGARSTASRSVCTASPAVEPTHEEPSGLVEELRYGQGRVVAVAQVLEHLDLDAVWRSSG
jgi:hypothetical protein